MTYEEMFQLDPKVWPLAVMAFLRVATIFAFLPIMGETSVPRQLRICMAIVFTVCLWPGIQHTIHSSANLLQWSPITLAIATFREVLYGAATAYAARLVLYSAAMGANVVGVNMGFQTATIFSQASGHEESAFSTLHGWLALVLMLALNIHHVFLHSLAESFTTIPIGVEASSAALLKSASHVAAASLLLGIKLAAPLLVLQLLVNIALGCLTRSVPQLNVFVLSFPISFLLGMLVLFVGAGMYIRFLAGEGMGVEVNAFHEMQRMFAGHKGGVP